MTDDGHAAFESIVAMYLDFAEDKALRRKAMTMRDWREKLEAFLLFNERDVLRSNGRVVAEVASRLATGACEHFPAGRLAIRPKTTDTFELELAAITKRSRNGHRPHAPRARPTLGHARGGA